jgi:hypothetical protein
LGEGLRHARPVGRARQASSSTRRPRRGARLPRLRRSGASSPVTPLECLEEVEKRSEVGRRLLQLILGDHPAQVRRQVATPLHPTDIAASCGIRTATGAATRRPASATSLRAAESGVTAGARTCSYRIAVRGDLQPGFQKQTQRRRGPASASASLTI